MKEKISVCIATYNGCKYIRQQLYSILSQLSVEDEIIIVDDCSKDTTVEIINNINDQRIKIYLNDCNIGFVKSFEKAVYLAKNDIIFLSDQDDEWFQHKVKKVVNVFQQENFDLVIHNAQVVDEDKKEILRHWYNSPLGNNIFTRHFINNHNMGCMMAFKRNLSQTLFPFPKIVESHDQWIGLNADIENKKVYFLNENLMVWIRHGNNASSMKPRRVYKIILSRIKMAILVSIAYYRFFRNWLRKIL